MLHQDGDPYAFRLFSAVQNSTLPTGPDTQGQWIQYAESASGEGVSNSTGVAIEPSIVVNSADDEFIAWADDRTGIYQIYVAEHTSSGWQEIDGSAEGGGISEASVNSTQPSIMLNAAGQPEVVWTETNKAPPIFSCAILTLPPTPRAAGKPIGSSLCPSGGTSNTGGASNAQIVNTASGPVVAWLNSNSGATNVYVREFNGTTWATLGREFRADGRWNLQIRNAVTPGFLASGKPMAPNSPSPGQRSARPPAIQFICCNTRDRVGQP